MAGSVPNSRAEEIRERLKIDSPELLERFPIRKHIGYLDATPRNTPYHHVTPEVSVFWREILDGYGREALETYNRATMLALIDAFEERAASQNFPESIVDLYRLSFNRIEKTIAEAEFGAYLHDSDDLHKDLAICQLKVFPAGGAQIVAESSGFSRTVFLSGGIGQFFRFLYFLLFVIRGNAPFYVTHTHNSEIKEFTPEGRDGCYVCIAEMLERNPKIKGWFNGAWFNDPALEKISPRLAYLRKRPQENGAWVFRRDVDIDGGALTKSATRRKLYEAGEYIPTGYLVVWPRRKIIAWANRQIKAKKIGDAGGNSKSTANEPTS